MDDVKIETPDEFVAEFASLLRSVRRLASASANESVVGSLSIQEYCFLSNVLKEYTWSFGE